LGTFHCWFPDAYLVAAYYKREVRLRTSGFIPVTHVRLGYVSVTHVRLGYIGQVVFP
jgi:hypothetical protein